MATATRPESVLLDGVTWADYEEQLRIIGDRRLRVTYNSGSMEIMAPILWRHGDDGYLLGRMVTC